MCHLIHAHYPSPPPLCLNPPCLTLGISSCWCGNGYALLWWLLEFIPPWFSSLCLCLRLLLITWYVQLQFIYVLCCPLLLAFLWHNPPCSLALLLGQSLKFARFTLGQSRLLCRRWRVGISCKFWLHAPPNIWSFVLVSLFYVEQEERCWIYIDVRNIVINMLGYIW